MTKKLFYSVYLEGDNPISNFQICLKSDLISESSAGLKNPVQINENCYVEEFHLDHVFLENLVYQDPNDIGLFLDFHRDEYIGHLNEFVKKVDFLFKNFKSTQTRHHYQQIASSYNPTYRVIDPFVDEIKDWISNINPSKVQKLKWNGTPSQFGYIFLELAQNGFIEVPKTGGIDSYSKYAAYCMNLFDINTTQRNLVKELNQKSNSLTYANRKEFKIPERNDLSKSK